MKTKTAPILFTSVLMNEMNKTMTFREITEKDELEKAFRFRYEEYSKSSNHVLLKHNIYRLDINSFDIHSRHFGIFSTTNELIGYLRVILDKTEIYNLRVYEIGVKYDLFSVVKHAKENLPGLKVADYPFLSLPNVPENVKSYYSSLKSNNNFFAEGGRLMIKEEFRGLRVSNFLLDCAMMLFSQICLGKKHAVLCCDSHHIPLYKRCGFQLFGGDNEFDVYGTNKIIMYFPLNTLLPEHLKIKVEEMAIVFSQTSKISRAL
jgi:predicted GNAT family N-acyltransferase